MIIKRFIKNLFNQNNKNEIYKNINYKLFFSSNLENNQNLKQYIQNNSEKKEQILSKHFQNNQYKVLQQTINKKDPFQRYYYLYNNNKKNDKNKISFWNDIPINLQNDIVNCCIQIPKQHSAKLQVLKQRKNHPFVQDTRKNFYTKQKQLRYYAQFPLFNYGFIPQTWQQNLIADNRSGQSLFGDDDPIDICQISFKSRAIGQIIKSKVLGSFCLIDQGQIDWKIILLDEQQAIQNNIQSINDISSRHIQSIMRWFKQIKIYDGKKPNKIAYNQKIFNKEETIQVIKEVHQEWKKLLKCSDKEYAGVQSKRKDFFIEKLNI